METISNLLDLFPTNNEPLPSQDSEEFYPLRVKTEYVGTPLGSEYEAAVRRLVDYHNQALKHEFYEALKPYAQNDKPKKGFWDNVITFFPTNLGYYGLETSTLYREVMSYLEAETGDIKGLIYPSTVLAFNEGAFRYYSGSHQTTIKRYTVSNHSYGDVFVKLCKEYPHLDTDHFHVVELESWDRVEILDPSKFHFFPGTQETDDEVSDYRLQNQ